MKKPISAYNGDDPNVSEPYAQALEVEKILADDPELAVIFEQTSLSVNIDATPEHKMMKVYETDHIPPKHEYVTEILAWLDRYLGPVGSGEGRE